MGGVLTDSLEVTDDDDTSTTGMGSASGLGLLWMIHPHSHLWTTGRGVGGDICFPALLAASADAVLCLGGDEVDERSLDDAGSIVLECKVEEQGCALGDVWGTL